MEMKMSDVIFARPRHNYQSYQDVYRVIELSGYPLAFVGEVDWSQSITVIGIPCNEEFANVPVKKRARFIHWNIERQRDDVPPMDMASTYKRPFADETWVSDKAMADRIGSKYVFLGGHQSLGSTDFRHKEFDVITLMANFGRRVSLFNELRQFKLADTGSLWGDERHERLKASRLMLSCHQDDHGWIEPPRFMLAGCYALPLLSEKCDDAGYWCDGQHMITANFKDLAQVARLLLNDEVRLARLGAAAWRLVCVERSFKREVEAAL